MAKLPSLRPTRPVPELQSAQMAGLKGDLRQIQARTDAVQQVTDAARQAIETESKLDARRRLNQFQRDYRKAQGDEIRAAHANLDEYDPSTLGDNLRTQRETLAEQAMEGASPLARRLLGTQIDDYNTQVTPFEQKAMADLANSRSIMQLDLQGRALLEDLTDQPGRLDDVLAEHQAALDDTGDMLPQTTRIKSQDAFKLQAINASVTTWAANGRLDEMSRFMESDAYKSLSVDNQIKVQSQVKGLAGEVYTDEVGGVHQQLINGEIDLATAQNYVASVVHDMPGYTDYETTQQQELARQETATLYFASLIASDNHQQVLDELPDNPDVPATKRIQMMGQAQAGLNTRTTVSTALARQGLQDAVASATETGTAGPQIMEAKSLLLEMPEGSQRDALEDAITEAEILVAAGQTAHGYHNLSQTDLMSEMMTLGSGDALDAYAGGDNFTTHSAARDLKLKAASAIYQSRDDDIAAYTLDRNAELRSQVSAFEQKLPELDDDAAAREWQVLRTKILAEQDALGIPAHEQRAITTTRPMVGSVASVLSDTSSTRLERLAALNTVSKVFASDAYDVVLATTESTAMAGAAYAYAEGQPDVALGLIEGINRAEALKTAGVSMSTVESATHMAGGYPITDDVWGRQAMEFREQATLLALSSADMQQVERDKRIDKSVYNKAVEQIVGERTNQPDAAFGQYTYPYTGATANTMFQQLDHIRLNGVPGVTAYGADGNAISWEDVVTRGQFMPYQGSLYQVNMDTLGGSGFLLADPDAKTPLLIDMATVPLSGRRRQQLQGIYVGRDIQWDSPR